MKALEDGALAAGRRVLGHDRMSRPCSYPARGSTRMRLALILSSIMSPRRSKLFLLSAVAITAACAATAQVPVQNIDPERHGNLAAAQRLVVQAFERLNDAQNANDYQLGGHAARAKELLRQANDEIKMAAEAANRR